jgi:uracil-DNA glycosylase family 4
VQDYLQLNPEDVYFTNAVLCLPKQNNGKYPVKSSQITNCAPNIRMMIDRINPRMIVTMGAKALAAIKNVEAHSFEFGSLVGSPLLWYSRFLYPMAHPGMLGRVNRAESVQREDFMRLAQIIRLLCTPHSEESIEHVV